MPTVRQRYRQTDGRTTYDSNTALCIRASRGKNWKYFTKLPETLPENSVIPGNSRRELLGWRIPGNSREFPNGNSRWPCSSCSFALRMSSPTYMSSPRFSSLYVCNSPRIRASARTAFHPKIIERAILSLFHLRVPDSHVHFLAA